VSAGRFLSAEEIATELGVSPRTAYRVMRDMRQVRIGALLKVQRVEFENWIRRQTEMPWRHESSDEGESSTRGFPASKAARASSPRTAPTARPPRRARPSSSESPLIRLYAAANQTTVQTVVDDYARSRARLGRSEGTLHHVNVKAGHVLRVLRDVLDIGYARDVSHAVLVRYIDHRESVRGDRARRQGRGAGLRDVRACVRDCPVFVRYDRTIGVIRGHRRRRRRALRNAFSPGNPR
jgi:predicted DNA-binding transcriptional regulator AlpA